MFSITPDEAQPFATAMAKYLAAKKMKVMFEVSAWTDAPYRTTLTAITGGLRLLIEAQGQISYGRSLVNLAEYLRARRHYAEFSIVTPSEGDVPYATLQEMRRDGVGWFLVDDRGAVTEQEKARNWALVVHPDPNLKWGRYQPEVQAAVAKFNQVERKDGMRDLCELFEREVENLAILATRKGLMKVPESAIANMELSDQINTLASSRTYMDGVAPVVDDTLKIDLHSFRSARNLVDHKVRGKRESKRRDMQFHDKMLQGTRLIAEIVSIQNRLRRRRANPSP